MADYYPLIARAIGGLSDRSPGMRNAVYTRARDALMGQLRSLDPPLPEAAIEQERTALEAAIERVEREQGPGAPGTAPAAAPRPQPAPTPAPDTSFRPRPAPAPAAGSPPPPAPPRDPAPTGQGAAPREAKLAPPARPLPAAAQPERAPAPPLGQPRPDRAPAPAVSAGPRSDSAPAPAASARPRPETTAPLPPPRPRPEPGAPPAGARPAVEAPPPARPRQESEAATRAPRPAPEASPPARPRDEPAAAPSVRSGDEPEPAPTGFKLPVSRDRTRPPAAQRPSPPAAAAPGARRPAVALAGGEPAVPDAAVDAAPASSEPADAETGDAFATAEADLTVRPRIGTQAPVTVNPGRGRSLILSAVLVVVIGLIGLLAWTLRDRPDELPRPGAVAEAPSPAEGSKIGERVGGPPSPAPAAPATPAAPEPRPAPRVEANANPMAVLYEEDQDNPQVPKTTGGRVTWRTDALNAGQGQPLDTAIRATVEILEAGFTLSLVIRRNLDATLPASHTVELNFTTRPGDPARVVRDVGVLQFRNDVNTRGTPVAGLPVPVRDNLFLIGLSNLPIDLDRNMELLRRRNWIDLPIRMASGQRAIVSFEKGAPGEAVVAEAIRQWQQ